MYYEERSDDTLLKLSNVPQYTCSFTFTVESSTARVPGDSKLKQNIVRPPVAFGIGVYSIFWT